MITHFVRPIGSISLFLILYFIGWAKVTTAQIKPIRPFGKIHALVVGISDYQHPKITDLSYAHRDAEAFARFLQSETHWQLDREDIVLLTDEAATYAKFLNELQALTERCAPKDRLILYFSGHGDVEVVSKERMGYLLFYDASPTTYASGGACMVNTLDQYLRTMVLEKEVEVFLISDACRSGALAGSKVGGPRATTAAVAELFTNSIKILSCEPEEFSLEGPQWGGGRGVFSYYLVKGLQGQADTDRDLYVDLFELRRYVQDSVREASERRQTPFINGGLSSVKMVRVKPEVAGRAALPSPPAVPERPVVADTGYLAKLARFEAAVARKHLLFPDSGSAYQIYQAMPDHPVKKVMKISLATALQDEAQQALNEYITSPGKELARRWADQEVYAHYPAYLEKAAALLSDARFFQDDVISREHYFRGVNLRLAADASETTSDSLLLLALNEQQTALQRQPVAPHIYNELGLLYRRLGDQLQELSNFQKAVALSPKWGLALTNLAYSYKRMGQPGQAEQLYEEAIATDENLALSHYNLAVLYQELGRKAPAVREFQRVIELDPRLAEAYYNLADLYTELPGMLPQAEAALLTYLDYEPDDTDGYALLAYVYNATGEWEKARATLEKALSIDSNSYYSHYLLLQVLIRQGDYAAARQAGQAAVAAFPDRFDLHYLLLEALAFGEHQEAAIRQLEIMLEMGYDDYDRLTTAPSLKDIRAMDRFGALLKTYFPDR